MNAAKPTRSIIRWQKRAPMRSKSTGLPIAPTTPTYFGPRAYEWNELADLARYIDWTPFFQTWELKGRYPAILDDPAQGAAASLFDDAQAMLKRIIDERWFTPKAVVGFWPAAQAGDDIQLFADDARATPSRLCSRFASNSPAGTGGQTLRSPISLRPRQAAPTTMSVRSLSPRASPMTPLPSTSSTPTTTIRRPGQGAGRPVRGRFAEAMHARVRRELWGFAPDEGFTPDELIAERYKGIRPAPGYPAQPDHTEKATLFRLLDAEPRPASSSPKATPCGRPRR